MNQKTEMISLFSGVTTAVFFEDLLLKIVATAVSMFIGATIAFFWRRHLERKFKDK